LYIPYPGTPDGGYSYKFQTPGSEAAASSVNVDSTPRLSFRAQSPSPLSSTGPSTGAASAVIGSSSPFFANVSRPTQPNFALEVSKAKSKRRQARLTAEDRRRICEQHLANPKLKQESLGALFGVERSTVSKILKNRERWLDPDNRTPSARTSLPRYPGLERELVEWCRNTLASADGGGRITDDMLRSRALVIASKSEAQVRKRFKASAGWMEGFKVGPLASNLTFLYSA
jgi:hypothetical protein